MDTFLVLFDFAGDPGRDTGAPPAARLRIGTAVHELCAVRVISCAGTRCWIGGANLFCEDVIIIVVAVLIIIVLIININIPVHVIIITIAIVVTGVQYNGRHSTKQQPQYRLSIIMQSVAAAHIEYFAGTRDLICRV